MTDNNQGTTPRVFISYSWDSPEHKLWVESFARELRKEGIDARIDAWRDESQSIDDFMMLELERAEFVLAICTPQYKQKIIENAEGDTHTASGFEMGTAAALRRAGGKDIIPVLRAGEWTEAAPSSLLSYRFYDFTGGDLSAEFEQLRERLLGHVHSAPELGQPKGPVAGPDLPDIFAGGSTPAPRKHAMPASSDAPRSAPPPPSPQPVAAAAPAKKGGKNWIWALGGAVGVIVLIMLIPTDDEGGVDPGPPTAQIDSQASGAIDKQDEGVMAETTVDTEDWSGTVDEAVESVAPPQTAPVEQPQVEVAAGWMSLSGDSGCMQLTQLAANTWLGMAYDPTVDLFYLQVYDPQWEELPVGQTDRVVVEFDENAETAHRHSVEGILDESDGSRGIQIQLVDNSFLGRLGQHYLMSLYWDDDPYTESWVMDADLRGSGGAYSSLANCAAGFGR